MENINYIMIETCRLHDLQMKLMENVDDRKLYRQKKTAHDLN